MISILTDPLPFGDYLIPEIARYAYRNTRDLIYPPKYNYGKYRGHYAVTRSLIEGLRSSCLPHNYNPMRLADLSQTVLVLAGVRTLRQAIQFKQKGHIKKLFAGPNIMIFSSDYNSLLASDEVDGVITPSQNIVNLYIEDNPTLLGRCFSWPAGVDINYWIPGRKTERNTILIFEKQNKGPVGPVEPYATYLRDRGFFVEIIKYGTFIHEEYRSMLRRCRLMIGFVMDESQGIAWAEAWSADVPTLIWRNNQNTLKGRMYSCSTAPYLTDVNGLFFDDFDDFKIQFAKWENNPTQFSPRTWVLENMSDEVCAKHLYKIVTTC